MGVNCWTYLPAAVRIDDVAKVAAALIGHKSRHESIGGSDGIFAHVDGWKTTTANETMPHCAYIVLDATIKTPAAEALRDSDGDAYHLLYHFESGRNGEKAIGPKCTAVKIALCVGLVSFFGGTVDFNDCDDVDVDFRRKPKPDIHASDGEEWDRFQKRILAVKPLTQEDIGRYAERSAH